MAHRTAPTLAAVALAVMSVAGCRSSGAAAPPGTSAPGPIAAPEAGPPAAPPPGARSVTVLAVLDGDSLEVLLEGVVEELRIQGVNTPERDECWSDRAREITAEILQGADVAVIAEGRDQYGRLLAHVWSDGNPVGLALLERGAGLAVSVDPGHEAAYRAAEEAAYLQGAGLWAPDACGPPRSADVAITATRFDAPGPDDEDPNGEWVELTNHGGPLDLSGWVIRDESSVHRYRFPGGFVLAGGARVTVRSGCGTDRPDEVFWCEGPVWSNEGDTALLLDPVGNVIDRVRG